ncbi:uncharacterized protein LOC122847647 [Aphidius gifuensis]|uniref:uncharacterized protein LOC122847647 n=1 Tax=Aphidius gifuensis TaxID=684658 RepID=UPI001CDC4BC5|nr:uncharacterized protein LOC122847647 [Aphidius gifuensis]
MSAKRICIKRNQQIFNVGDKDPKVVINSLDYDSLAKIIMLLPIPERLDMEEVCTKWKEACQLAWYDIKEYKCKSSIGRCYDNRLLTQSYLKEILLRCGNYLDELSLSNVCNSSIMPFVGDHCKNLTTLECKFNDKSLIDNADDFVQVFTHLDRLKCIKITIDHYCWNEVINLSAIIDSLTEEINEIHLFSKSESDGKRRGSMSFKKFKNLEKLTLHGFWLENIQEIAEKTTLVHLDIQFFDILTELFLFNELVNLEYIDLTMGAEFDEVDNFSTKILNTIFCTCKNLKHLDIPRGSYDVAKIPLEKWINFQNLQHLGMCCDIMPDLANTIVKYCKSLKYLRIHYPHELIDKTAFEKLTELENLECLILNGLHIVHEESITAISKNCKKLKHLEIPYCFQLFSSPNVLDELSKLQYLEHLSLCAAFEFEDSTIIAIANNCKNLKSLDIQDYPALTEAALVALTNLKNLEKLNVGSLDIITDSFLIKLRGLKKLHCNLCMNITDAGVIQFIKNNPDLEKISVGGIDNITIDLIIGADQATKNRTNGIILHIRVFGESLLQASKTIITSQWLVVEEMI